MRIIIDIRRWFAKVNRIYLYYRIIFQGLQVFFLQFLKWIKKNNCRLLINPRLILNGYLCVKQNGPAMFKSTVEKITFIRTVYVLV